MAMRRIKVGKDKCLEGIMVQEGGEGRRNGAFWD
jgi:hypothetical protein